MYRKFITLITAVILSVNFFASASTIEFTYAEGELFGYGQGMKESIDVAMCIDNPSLAGMKIKNIRAYLSGTEGYENTSLWMSKSLNLVDKVNVPDIASYSVDPVESPYGGESIGMLSIDLPEPYLLTGQPVYIGYSLTVTENTTPQQKYPIVVSEGSNSKGFFLHMSKSVLKWMDYSKKAGGVAYIVVTLEGEISEYSLSINSYTEANVMVDTDFDMEFNVNNAGNMAVSDISYSYSYDDSDEVYQGYASLPVALEPDLTVSMPVTLSFRGINDIGPHILKLRIAKVNGNPNSSSSAYKECLVNVMPYAPVHRPLVEEFTGLWCGWCPRGWIGMEMLGEKFGSDVVIVCYHNGDDMAVTNTYPVEVSGYPSAVINRGPIIDPYFGTYNENVDFGIAYNVENAMADMTIVDLGVEASLEGNCVYATTSTTFMKDIYDGNYAVGYVLTCNGLSNPAWAQVNNFAGLGAQFKGTYLEPLTEMPRAIRGLVFNDVAVDVAAMKGVEGSLPSEIKTARTYTHTYTFDIADNPLISDPENLVVNAFIIDMNTGAILNSAKYAFAVDSEVHSIYDDGEVTATEYYDLNGLRIERPAKGILIKKERLADGTYRVGKIIF